MADVIAQVAGLPISEVTISRIQQKLSVFFQEVFETLTESRIAEWTKKVGTQAPAGSQTPLAWNQDQGLETETPRAWSAHGCDLGGAGGFVPGGGPGWTESPQLRQHVVPPRGRACLEPLSPELQAGLGNGQG